MPVRTSPIPPLAIPALPASIVTFIGIDCQQVQRIRIPDHRFAKILHLAQRIFTPLALPQTRPNRDDIRPLQTLFERAGGQLMDHQFRPGGQNGRNVVPVSQDSHQPGARAQSRLAAHADGSRRTRFVVWPASQPSSPRAW